MNTENQIDHVCISKKFRRSLQDVRVKRGADAATDHHLIVANVKLKLKKHQNIESTGKRFNISMLENKTKKSEFQIELKNRFSIFQNAAEEIISIEDHWQEIKMLSHQLARHHKTRSAKQSASREYTIANKDVRNSARRDKRAFVDKLTAEAEKAARANNIKALYDNIKLLTGKHQKGSRPVKSTEGKTLNTHERQMKRWVEHFNDVLNQDPPVRKADIPPSEELLAVDCKRPSTGEIKMESEFKLMGNYYQFPVCIIRYILVGVNLKNRGGIMITAKLICAQSVTGFDQG
ncbi:unnamed protein product [Mytilus edulis]|uniref:Uncharacterized protein n=1 Tax=Mytilus edulis TaxID=6550 RepID=A0A8S3PPP9_MYTED|nr:unnamed protein product [Mytilus edulis]